MSLVVTRPPRPPRVLTARGNRRVYTLHSEPRNVFAWRITDERVKTATVVFRRPEDAHTMAYAIETHVNQTKEWPDLLVTENAFKVYSGPTNAFSQGLVYVQSWQIETLKEFCAMAYLDMIVLSSMIKKRDTYLLNGEICMLSAPSEFYIHRLEQLYDSNNQDEE